jgi:hypothetical protein
VVNVLNLSGNFTKNATTTLNYTAVNLNGMNQIISLTSTTTIGSLTKALGVGSSTPMTLTFGTTSPLIITGTTTLTGLSDNQLKLRSIATGTPWYFSPNGNRVVDYLDVQDSYNISSTTIAIANIDNFTNSGNNVGWSFTQPNLTLGRFGEQIATTTATTTNQDLGGAFTLTPDGGNFTLSALKFKQKGSFATSGISNIKVYYEASTTCALTKPSSATLYGTTDSFNEDKIATTTFSPPITLTNGSTTCLYFRYDLSGLRGLPTLGQTVDLEITNPSTDLTVTGGTASPSSRVNIAGVTMIDIDNPAVVASSSPITNPVSQTNTNCSSNEITSLLSLGMRNPAKDPTLYYLQNCIVWKKEGSSDPYRISDPNLQVHDLSFNKGQGGIVSISMTTSNMDPDAPESMFRMVRTLSTSAVRKSWTGE